MSEQQSRPLHEIAAEIRAKRKPQEYWQEQDGEQYSWYGWTVEPAGKKWVAYKWMLPGEYNVFDSKNEAMIAIEDFVTYDYALRNFDKEDLDRMGQTMRDLGSVVMSECNPPGFRSQRDRATDRAWGRIAAKRWGKGWAGD